MPEIDLADVDGFWGRSIEYRNDAFARLRRENPVPFCAEPELGYGERGPGFFAVTRFGTGGHRAAGCARRDHPQQQEWWAVHPQESDSSRSPCSS
jgi:hypothetical protein